MKTPLVTATFGVSLLLASCVQEATSRQADESTQTLSWSEFKRSVGQEPSGLYIVDGDTPIRGEKHLREFYDRQINGPSSLILAQEKGVDSIWDKRQRTDLRYCVAREFGARYDQVVSDMAAAGKAWADVTDVRFVHVAMLDATCTAQTADVVFNVNPTPSPQSYLARAFFPSSRREDRNVLIDASAFTSTTPGMSLVGILRHELGHTLGFRHEHTRPQSGSCFEDTNWRPLTEYDPLSVMHYPQCNGKNTWALPLSELDVIGARRIYGLPGGAPSSGGTQTVAQRFEDEVLVGQPKVYGPFSAAQGTVFRASLSGSIGDADLYVRAGAAPTLEAFDCRPFADDSNETCSLDVKTAANYFVMVVGYSKKAANAFSLVVTRESPVDAPVNDRCESALPISLNPSGTVVVGTASRAAERRGASCGAARTRALAYTFSFSEPTGLVAQATSSRGESLTLSLQDVCTASHEVTCDASGRLYVKRLAAGSYTLWVDSVSGADFSLELRTFDPASAPLNETRETAQPLVLVNGKAHVSVDTFLARDDAATTCGGTTPDLVYSLAIEHDGIVALNPSLVDGTLPTVLFEDGQTLKGNCSKGINGWFGPSILSSIVKVKAGTSFVWVESVTPWAKLDLDIETWPTEPVANDGCSTALPLLVHSNSQTVNGSTLFASPSFGGFGNDVAYTFTLAQPRVISAKLDAGARSFGVLQLGIQSGCQAAAPPFVSNTTFEQTLGPGTYTLWVGSMRDGWAGDFSLTVTSQEVPPAPANDRCDAAQVIDVEKGPLTMVGSTRGANADQAVLPNKFYSAWGNQSPDVAYAFELTKSATVTFSTDFAKDHRALLFTLSAQCAGQPFVEDFTSLTTHLSAGRYLLWVKTHAFSTWQTGEFGFTTSIQP